VLVAWHFRLDRLLKRQRMTAITIIAAFAFMQVFMIRILRFPYGDANYFSSQARWVLQGLLPYRDFHCNYGPLFPYYNAIGLKIAGGTSGVVVGLAFAYVAGVLAYARWRLEPLVGAQAKPLLLLLVFSPLS
jgi:hypothetical protein